MQSSMSKLQEQIQTKKKKTKRLEYQIASLLKEKRLQLEKEKSWKQQTTMTKQKQVNKIILLFSNTLTQKNNAI